MQTNAAHAALVGAKTGASLLDISERKFHELRKREDFPRPVVLGARVVRWRVAELMAWAASLPAESSRPEPEQLRRARTAAVAGQ